MTTRSRAASLTSGLGTPAVPSVPVSSTVTLSSSMPNIEWVFKSSLVTDPKKLQVFVNYVDTMRSRYQTVGVHDSIISCEAFFPDTNTEVWALKDSQGLATAGELLDFLRKRLGLTKAANPTQGEEEAALANCFDGLRDQPDKGEFNLDFEQVQAAIMLAFSRAKRERALVVALEKDSLIRDGKAPMEKRLVFKVFEKVPVLHLLWCEFLKEVGKNSENTETYRVEIFKDFLRWPDLKMAWWAYKLSSRPADYVFNAGARESVRGVEAAKPTTKTQDVKKGTWASKAASKPQASTVQEDAGAGKVQPQAGATASQPKGDGSNGDGMRKTKCFRCGQFGHLRGNCPQKVATTSTKDSSA